MSFYVGAPVWGAKFWVGNFFPPKSKQHDFLSLYSRRLNTVEGNTTFYALPSPETVARWVAETPPDFRFCLKFPKPISHEKRLVQAETETKAFLTCMELLGEKAGPSFLQLPPTFSARELPALANYLAALPTTFRYAVEVRHNDFFKAPGEAALDELLQRHNIARCSFDTRGLRRAEAKTNPILQKAQAQKPHVPERFTRTASFALVRFVGHPEIAQNADLLDEWVEHVAQWLATGDDVFFFCHLPDDQGVPQLCRDFHARVNARFKVPPMPEWDEQGVLQDRLL